MTNHDRYKSPFISLRKRSPEFSQGYRAGVHACTRWLEGAAIEYDYSGTNRGAPKARTIRRAIEDMSVEAQAFSFVDGWDGPEVVEEPTSKTSKFAEAFIEAFGKTDAT